MKHNGVRSITTTLSTILLSLSSTSLLKVVSSFSTLHPRHCHRQNQRQRRGHCIGTTARTIKATSSSKNSPTTCTTSASGTALSLIMNADATNDSDSSSSSSPTIIEVEQKFVVSRNLDSLKERLSQLGFQSKSVSSTSTHTDDDDADAVTFMDWYFDLLPADQLVLCTQDNWLRYRHMSNDASKGSWQLKQGNGNVSTRSTVYQEIEGNDALLAAHSMLLQQSKKLMNENNNSSNNNKPIVEMDGYQVPVPRIAKDSQGHNDDDDSLSLLQLLQPYARIETTRLSWTRKIHQEGSAGNGEDKEKDNNNLDGSSVYNFISVDIDATDFGHMVGEVECVVSNEDEISEAKARIQTVIGDLMDETGGTPALSTTGNEPNANNRDTVTLGKLETYLIQKQPEIYQACVGAGTMKDRKM